MMIFALTILLAPVTYVIRLRVRLPPVDAYLPLIMICVKMIMRVPTTFAPLLLPMPMKMVAFQMQTIHLAKTTMLVQMTTVEMTDAFMIAWIADVMMAFHVPTTSVTQPTLKLMKMAASIVPIIPYAMMI